MGLVGMVLAACLAVAAGDDSAVSFKDHVAPILVRKCLGCHNPKKAENGLDISTYARLRKGGKSEGALIVEPGDPDASGLIESIRPGASPRMPLRLPPLTDVEVGILTRWVKAGAKFDGPSASESLLTSLVDPLRNLPRIAPTAPVVEPVRGLALLDNGRHAVAAVGRSLRLLDLTGKESPVVVGQRPGPLNAVSLLPGGKQVVACGGRPGMTGDISVWDLERRTLVFELQGHADAILAAALTPDGTRLATTGFDRVVKVWDLPARKLIHSLADHTDSVLALAFSPDGAMLASAGADRSVRLWSVVSGKKLDTLTDATGEVTAVAFSPDGQTVYASGSDRTIRAWKIAAGHAEQTAAVFAHQGPILRLLVASTPSGPLLVSSAEDRAVRFWEIPSLRPRGVAPSQPDWPQALAVDAQRGRLVIGRHDGTLAVSELASGKIDAVVTTRLPQADGKPAATAPRPALFRNATLNPPSPRGIVRGATTRVALSGEAAGRAIDVLVDEPGLTARIVPDAKAGPNRLAVDFTVAPGARLGLHRVGVVTPSGTSPLAALAIEADPAVAEQEPNNALGEAKPLALPTVWTGAIETAGDVDLAHVDLKAGQALVVQSTARVLGSTLNPRISLLDADGRTLAEKTAEPGQPDPLLVHRARSDGAVYLKVADLDFGGSANHFYRLSVNLDPIVTTAFPLAASRGQSTRFSVVGANLGDVREVDFRPDPSLSAGSMVTLPVTVPGARFVQGNPLVVVADGPQVVETDATAASPLTVAVPGGVSGRIARAGEVDRYRFAARRGERVVLEVFGRRLGSPIDPVIEVLDDRGGVVPRAVLRVVGETEVAFRDHDGSKPGIRLTRWNNLAVNDLVLIGRELTRVFALPRNPDDDCLFWSEQGQRTAVLETTTEHHPMGQPIWKVEVLAPGSSLTAEGQPPVTLPYRNDDGGPAFGRDSHLTFDPPADGTYVVRVGDSQLLGGPDFVYHLVLRRPAPDYRLVLGTENPNIPRGGTVVVPITLTRLDGFEDAVTVEAVGLPPGVRATPAVVERGAFTGQLALTAASDAPAFTASTWSIRARDLPGGSDARPGALPPIEHTIDPGGPLGGRITVVPREHLRVSADATRVVVRPGETSRLTLRVQRGMGFAGRVPIEVRNLPLGVRVLDVGLNGVLVTEAQTARTIVLFAEPWAEPMERAFYAVGKAEAAATESSSEPITLVVAPSPTTRQSPATPGR